MQNFVDNFSVFNYDNLSEEQKSVFNKALAQELSALVDAIRQDDVIGSLPIEEFVSSCGKSSNAATVVAELYSRISGGIQAGSGNHRTYLMPFYML